MAESDYYKFIIRLPPELYDELKSESNRTGLPAAAIIRQILAARYDLTEMVFQPGRSSK